MAAQETSLYCAVLSFAVGIHDFSFPFIWLQQALKNKSKTYAFIFFPLITPWAHKYIYI